MFLYRFSMLFATHSPSRPKSNNVHVMNNLSTEVISFVHIYFISQVWMFKNTFINCFLFSPELEPVLNELHPSLFYNDVETLRDRINLSRKVIINALYYVRRVPFQMLMVDCVDGINIYYQMMEHIAQCVRDFSVHYIQYTPVTMVKKLPLCHRSRECSSTCREREKKNI